MGEAMSKIKEDTSRSNKGLMTLIYKIDKVMCKIKDFNHMSVEGCC